MQVTLRLLEYFVALAETGSYTAAGHQTGATRQAVSEAIQRIESIVGATLVETTTRQVVFTEAGREYLRHAQAALVTIQSGAVAAREAGTDSQHVLHLSFDRASFVGPAEPIVAKFRRSKPRVAISLETVKDASSAQLVVAGETDALFTTESISRSDLSVMKIGHDPMVVMVPRTHRFSTRTSITTTDLLGETLIAVNDIESETDRLVAASLQRDGVKSPIALDVANYREARLAVVAGLGLSIVNRAAAGPSSSDVAAVPLASAIGTTYWLVTPASGGSKHVADLCRTAETLSRL